MNPAGPPAPADPVRRAGSRAERTALGLLAAALLASLPFLVHPWYEPSGDASLYLVTSQALVAGQGYTYLGEPFIVHPPGFALLLAPVIATRGLDFQALNLYVALWGVAAAILLFAHARPRLGAPLALLLAVALWLNPGFRRLSNEILSDVPGLALALGCLLLERFASRRPSLRREALLGVAIGLSGYVRPVLLLLLPATLTARVLAPGAGEGGWLRYLALRCGMPAACAAALLLPWSLRDAAVRPETAVEQTRVYSHATAMWHVDPADPGSRRVGPGEILERVPLRALQVADSLGSRLQSEIKGTRVSEGSSLRGRLLVAALLLGSSLWALVRRREPAELFVWGTLVVLLSYFGFGERLLLPVYALALPAAAEALRDGIGRRLGFRAGTIAAGVALVALAAWDFHPRPGWSAIERRHRDFAALATALAERVPPQARLGTALGFSYSVYLGRPVYSLYFAIERGEDPRAAAHALIERHVLDHVVLWPAVPRERELIPYFEERYGPGEPVGAALLWRLESR